MKNTRFWVAVFSVVVVLLLAASQPEVYTLSTLSGNALADDCPPGVPRGCEYVMYSSAPQPSGTCNNYYICPQPVGSYGPCEKGSDFGVPGYLWFIQEHCEDLDDGGTCMYYQEIWWGCSCTGCEGGTLSLN